MEKNTINKKIREQFNKQAESFSRWSVTQNREYMQAYFTFCRMSSDDRLLDVACGSGEFSLFAAPKIKKAVGVDISGGMIELARRQASEQRISNVTFRCHDVSEIPCDDESFSIVVCKSAFHHIHHYDMIMEKMNRCCARGGRISIQDIVAYENDHVNHFFEELERSIDISHHVAVSKNFILDLYDRHNLTVTATYEVEIDLNFKDYLGHADQSEKCRAEIQRLLERGLNDSGIADYFTEKDGEIFFRRNVFMVLGTKG